MKVFSAMVQKLVVLLCTLFFMHGLAVAGEIPYITTADLKAKIDSGAPLTLANALSPIEHKEIAIVGSVNIPASKVTGNPNLPADKGSLLIFYCKGPKCGKSRIAAKKAIELGYSNVMVYNEGLPAWGQMKYPMDKAVTYPKVDVPRLQAQDVFNQKDSIVMLDIRGKKHMQLGKIENTVNILLDDMEEKYTALPKGKRIVVLDHAGKQTIITAKFLHMNGYTDVAVLDGGVAAWIRAGLPVVK